MSTSTRRSSRLRIGERQLVELARVLLDEPRLLILDEPNSALNERETERLFVVLRQLARPRHHHALRLAPAGGSVRHLRPGHDHRNGRDVLTTRDRAPHHSRGHRGYDRRPAGRAVSASPRRPRPAPLEADRRHGACSGGPLKDIVLHRPLGRDGRPRRPRRFGRRRPARHAVRAAEARVAATCASRWRRLPRSPTEAARRGVCLVPADRRRNGLMLDKDILFNISQVAFGAQRDGALALVSASGCARERASRQIDALRIKTRSPYALANQLSGGNQQKIVIGKWLEIGPEGVPARRPDPRRRYRRQARNLRADPRDVGRMAASCCSAPPNCPS